MANAHENMDSLLILNTLENMINSKDNRIDPSTIKETRRGISPFGQWINALYEGETFGGEQRQIFRSGYPSQEEAEGKIDRESQQLMLMNLLQAIKMNPDFADTLTAETRPQVKAELDYSGSPLKYLKHLFTGK
jgi:hypothetical protein